MRKWWILKYLITAFLLILCDRNVMAQLGTSSINGTVTDSVGAGISNAIIAIENKATGQRREVTSNIEGYFVIQKLSPALYDLNIKADGFESKLIKSLQLRVGETQTLLASLKPSNLVEIVEVKGNTGVDTTTSQISGIIGSNFVENLPLNGRNFLDLAFLLPGNAPAPNFDITKTNTIEVSSVGQLGRGGNIAVDGADNNDDFVGGTLQNFPIDSISQFQISTSSFGAEIGRTASSAVNIVTKSGTNELHGSAALFFRDDSLSALPATLNRTIVKLLGRPPFDRQQYAASVGGPIKKDKLWFFSALEYRNQDAIIVTNERDLLQRSVVNNFAAAPLNDLLFLARGDWQVSEKDKMFFRYSLQDMDDLDTFQTSGSSANRRKAFNNYQSFVYNYVRTISPRLLNDFSFHESNFVNFIPRFTNQSQVVFPSLQDGGNFLLPQRTRQNRLQFRDSLGLIAGQHSLKLGGEFHKVDADTFADAFGLGIIFTLEDFASLDRNSDGQVNDLDIPLAFTVRSVAPQKPPFVPNEDNKYLSFFFQDDWKVNRKLTLNLGLRYELDTNLKNPDFQDTNRQALALVPGRRKLDKNNFSPRIGFNLDLFGNGKTSVHGSYGIYYDRITLNISGSERLLNDTILPLEARTGSEFDINGNFLPGTPTFANPFVGSISPNLATIGVDVISPDLATPYVQQFSFGIRQQILDGLTVSIDGIHNFGSKFIIRRSIGNVVNPITGVENNLSIFESSVKNWYDGLFINVERKASNRFSFIASYTLSKALNFTNDDQLTQFSVLDPNNINLEKGPPPNDVRHRFSFASVLDLPYGLQIAPIFRLESGVPFDVFRPDGAFRIPAQRNAGGRQFKTGRDLNTFIKAFNASGGLNGEPLPFVREDIRLGDSFASFDIRIVKIVKVKESISLQGVVEVFNLFNVTNLRGSQGSNFSGIQSVLVRDNIDPNDPGFLRASSFGAKQQTAGGVFGTGGPRAFQFALRLSF